MRVYEEMNKVLPRDTVYVTTIDLQRIEQSGQVGGELVETVGAFRYRRAAVAAQVKRQHAEAGRL